jgi:predicted permease
MTQKDAAIFLKLIFYVCLPALMGGSVWEIHLSSKLLILPIIPFFIVSITFVLSYMTCRLLKLAPPTRGTFFVGTMVMNIGFMYPIGQGLYGTEGISQIAIFDIGQGFMAFVFAYSLACKYGEQVGSIREMIGKLLKSPPLWAILFAVCFNILGIPLTSPVKTALNLVGSAAMPLIMLAMGIFFTPKLAKLPALASAIGIRMIVGSFLGILLAQLLGVQGVTRVIATICSAAPAGHSTLTFSSLKNLDVEFAASLVPVSVFCGLVYIPILLYML